MLSGCTHRVQNGDLFIWYNCIRIDSNTSAWGSGYLHTDALLDRVSLFCAFLRASFNIKHTPLWIAVTIWSFHDHLALPIRVTVSFWKRFFLSFFSFKGENLSFHLLRASQCRKLLFGSVFPTKTEFFWIQSRNIAKVNFTKWSHNPAHEISGIEHFSKFHAPLDAKRRFVLV